MNLNTDSNRILRSVNVQSLISTLLEIGIYYSKDIHHFIKAKPPKSLGLALALFVFSYTVKKSRDPFKFKRTSRYFQNMAFAIVTSLIIKAFHEFALLTALVLNLLTLVPYLGYYVMGIDMMDTLSLLTVTLAVGFLAPISFLNSQGIEFYFQRTFFQLYAVFILQILVAT